VDLHAEERIFHGWSGDSIVLGVFGELRLPLAAVSKLEVRERGAWGASRGAGVVGLLGGAFAGLAIGAGACEDGLLLFTKEECVGLAAGSGAIVGAVLGVVVGMAVRTDRWKSVPLDRVRLIVAPSGAFAVGGALRF
jgi:hypothetical protein